jgi:hypothetical protein
MPSSYMYLTNGFLSILYGPFTLFYEKAILLKLITPQTSHQNQYLFSPNVVRLNEKMLLFTTKHHNMKKYGRVEVTDPRILNLDTR